MQISPSPAIESASDSTIETQRTEYLMAGNLILSGGAKEHREAIYEYVSKKRSLKEAISSVS
jgi:hypothetical protein